MANIFDKYGIKEVADVCFFKLEETGERGQLELFLDTLKVSTIEQTAETTSARGGKGNPELISWDYGKEITVTLEDALFSAKSMAILFGDGKVDTTTTSTVTRTAKLKAKNAASTLTTASFSTIFDTEYKTGKVKMDTTSVTSYSVVDESGNTVTSVESGSNYYVTWEQPVTAKQVITISGDTFPDTYYVIGDTYARSATSGKDEFFQFIIPKAKVTAENTITLEAEGDPSVFNLNLRVLRPDDGEMMKLIQYNPAQVE